LQDHYYDCRKAAAGARPTTSHAHRSADKATKAKKSRREPKAPADEHDRDHDTPGTRPSEPEATEPKTNEICEAYETPPKRNEASSAGSGTERSEGKGARSPKGSRSDLEATEQRSKIERRRLEYAKQMK